MQHVDKSPALSPLENAVLELVQQLPAMALYKAASEPEAWEYRLHEPIDLALEAVVERYPGIMRDKPVFAYQFMRTALDRDPYPRNLATFIPDVTANLTGALQMPWVTLQRPAGRVYATRVVEHRNISNEVAKALLLCATNPPAHRESLTHEDVRQMNDFVLQHGVMGAIEKLAEKNDCWQQLTPEEAPPAETPSD